MKNLFLYLLIIFLCSFSLTGQNKIDSLSMQVKSLEKLIKSKPLSITPVKDYKETFYLTQLSNSVTLILSVIGFALVFAGFSSYHFINERFRLQERSIEQQITNVISNTQSLITQSTTEQTIFKTEISMKLSKYEEDYKKYESNHIDFQFVLDYIQGNFYANLFNKNVDEKNAEMSLYYALISFSDFTKCCLSSSDKSNDEFKIEKIKYIKDALKNLLDIKKYKINVELAGTTNNNIGNIRRLDDVEIDFLLSKLQSSIEYEIRK